MNPIDLQITIKFMANTLSVTLKYLAQHPLGGTEYAIIKTFFVVAKPLQTVKDSSCYKECYYKRESSADGRWNEGCWCCGRYN